MPRQIFTFYMANDFKGVWDHIMAWEEQITNLIFWLSLKKMFIAYIENKTTQKVLKLRISRSILDQDENDFKSFIYKIHMME
jgi:hypothetical protein